MNVLQALAHMGQLERDALEERLETRRKLSELRQRVAEPYEGAPPKDTGTVETQYGVGRRVAEVRIAKEEHDHIAAVQAATGRPMTDRWTLAYIEHAERVNAALRREREAKLSGLSRAEPPRPGQVAEVPPEGMIWVGPQGIEKLPYPEPSPAQQALRQQLDKLHLASAPEGLRQCQDHYLDKPPGGYRMISGTEADRLTGRRPLPQPKAAPARKPPAMPATAFTLAGWGGW